MRRKIDLKLVIPIVLLSLLGSVNMLGIKPSLFISHTFFLILGFVIFFIIVRVRSIIFLTHDKLIYTLFIILFSLVFFIGSEVRGATRWLNLYFFRLQPSEFFKPFFLLLASSRLAEAGKRDFRWLLTSGIYLGLPILFILKQPDLGNGLLFGITFVAMLFFTGLPMIYFVFLSIFSILSLPLISLLLRDYQKARLFSFLAPNHDPLGLSYNLTQSTISVGSGGFFGKGLGLGTQSRFQFLPEYHTDFAFASFVEQFGFIGGLTLLVLFMIIIYSLFVKFSSLKGELVKRIYLMGTIIMLFLTIGINIGMNMGIMPVTGIALPFISYGGSATLSVFIMLAVAATL